MIFFVYCNISNGTLSDCMEARITINGFFVRRSIMIALFQKNARNKKYSLREPLISNLMFIKIISRFKASSFVLFLVTIVITLYLSLSPSLSGLSLSLSLSHTLSLSFSLSHTHTLSVFSLFQYSSVIYLITAVLVSPCILNTSL